MSVAPRVLWLILSQGSLFTAVLVLGGAVFVSVEQLIPESQRTWLAVILFALGVGGLAAVLTERIRRYSFAAGSLGLPGHTRIMQWVQGWFIALSLAVADVGAATLGMAPVAATALFFSAAAGGIVVATRPSWLIGLPLVVDWAALGGRQASPAGHLVAIAISGAVFWWWLLLPEKAGRADSMAPFADTRRERNVPVGVAGSGVASALAFAFDYSMETLWPAVWYVTGLAIALLALEAWQVISWGYGIVTLACCFGLGARLSEFLDRWLRSSAEQSLLRITPGWPADSLIKAAVVRSTLVIQRGSFCVWGASSLIAVLCGWIGVPRVMGSGLAMLGTALIFSGRVWATLAQRQIQEFHLSNVALALIIPAGVLVVKSPDLRAALNPAYGVGLMVIPPILALVWYLVVPLRLPVKVGSRRFSVDPRIAAISIRPGRGNRHAGMGPRS